MKHVSQTIQVAVLAFTPLAAFAADEPRVDKSLYYAGAFLVICVVIIGAQVWPILKKRYFAPKLTAQQIVDGETKGSHHRHS